MSKTVEGQRDGSSEHSPLSWRLCSSCSYAKVLYSPTTCDGYVPVVDVKSWRLGCSIVKPIAIHTMGSSPLCNDTIRGCDTGYLWCNTNECDGVYNCSTDQLPYGRVLSVMSKFDIISQSRALMLIHWVINWAAFLESNALYVVVMRRL